MSERTHYIDKVFERGLILMELQDILSLVKAGYSRDEIAQMEQKQTGLANPVPVQQPVQTAAPAPEPVPAQVVEPVPAPAPAPAPAPTPVHEPTMAELMESIAKLTSAVQANAIAQSVIPAGVSNPPSAEDALAEIIRPTFHQRSD